MNPVNGVTTNNGITTLNPADMSQQDFISAVYLERGEMLDSEVRRLVGEIETSNQMTTTINTLIGKANVAEYGPTSYTSPTWNHDGGKIVLDNGYGLDIRDDGNGGKAFTLTDADGNQLLYQNQTLIPIPSGTTVDALKVGIPVMSDLTLMLDDGTELTFKTSTPDTAFNQQNFSGGGANITSIFITRDNQGMSITNLDSEDSVVITGPTVETPTAPGSAAVEVKTQTVSVAAHSLETFVDYDEVEEYDTIDKNFANEMKSMWLSALHGKSPEEQAAMLANIKSSGGISINWRLQEYDEDNDNYTKSFSYSPHTNETLSAFVERMIDRSKTDFRNYVQNEEGVIDIGYVSASIGIPAYSFNEVIPNGDKTTATYASKSANHSRNFYGSEEYSSITEYASDYIQEIKSKVAGMTEEQKKGFEKKLREDGFAMDWTLKDSDDTDNTYNRSYSYKMVSGESIDNFIERAVNQSAARLTWYVKLDQDERAINIESIATSATLPAFSYDVYEGADDVQETNDPRPINVHSYDTNNNDGHVLVESGGLHSWEYGGTNVSQLTWGNPNDATDHVDGYFARKLTFENDLTNEFDGTIPFLTQKEKDLLTQALKIPYADVSGSGHLTPQEWGTLRTSLVNARDNLNGSSQLQTVQLQRAMLVYNQNFDAMSNAQQKIYSLLRDIMSNMK